MALDPRKLMALEFPEVRHDYGWRDTVLYALGLGFGADPIDPKQLRFVYEEGLEAMPTMANVLAHPGFWARDLDTGIDWKRIVHGEQAMTLHEPLPVQASVIGTTRIVDIVDKGAEKGAIIDVERVIREATTSRPLATLLQSIFCRGDGGFGGAAVSKREPVKLPERPPDFTQDMPTQPQQALVYRLSGDLNPLHADPVIAHKAGFPQPILHGLATFGVAGRALMERLCGAVNRPVCARCRDASRRRSTRARRCRSTSGRTAPVGHCFAPGWPPVRSWRWAPGYSTTQALERSAPGWHPGAATHCGVICAIST